VTGSPCWRLRRRLHRAAPTVLASARALPARWRHSEAQRQQPRQDRPARATGRRRSWDARREWDGTDKPAPSGKLTAPFNPSGARSRTLVITTLPLTFSVTFHTIVTLLPLEIACLAIRNSATRATSGHSSDGRLSPQPFVE